MRYRKMVEIIQNRWKVILAIIFLVILIWMGYVWLPDWTGFGEYVSPAVPLNQTYQPAKTLWDWMQLLIIPVILAGGAYWLNESTRKREGEIAKKHAETERKIASDNMQETALQTYLDKMTELLLDKKLRESEVGEVRAVARARTLTVLRRLDGERKGALLQFLYEADLIDKNNVVINLAKANLSGANLREANLSGANLREANLSGADLSWTEMLEADLGDANLSGADLSGAEMLEADLGDANLSGANLTMANLKGANLWRADLSGADLSWTEMWGANLTMAHLREAKYTKDTGDVLPGTAWPDGFDPVAAGAICVPVG